jgi:hypothetical protein
MSKMPYTDWREWATKRPDWMQQDVATTSERFVEKKWQDALNVAAAEPASWGMGREKPVPSGGALDRATPVGRGTLKITGAVNVVEQETPSRPHSPSWDVSLGRKCRARNLIECRGDHVLLQCSKLLSMGLNERKEVLERSGLCLFCLKHAAELECFGRGGLSKPRCTQAGCDGEHTPSVHKLVREESAGVNLVAEIESESEEDEDENEEWWVGTVGVMEMREDEEGASEEVGESESEEEAHLPTSSSARGSDSGLEREPEHPLGNHPTEGPEGDGWWSPGTPRLVSEEASGKPWKGQLPHPKGVKRRKLRKKEEKTRDQEWERARQDAWLREMLSDTSDSEDEGSCGRFAEPGRWISELFKISQHPATTQEGSVPDRRCRGCS